MANYKLSPNAVDDLYRIWLYGVKTWGLNAAEQYQHMLFEQFARIAQHPMHHADMHEIRQGYRRCVWRSQNIYFRMQDEAVEIMAILGKQDAQAWLLLGDSKP